jgi:phosphatidylserine/phosphatidylglycerophosphate/cardiolipin synthase-like enzyme
MSLRLAALALVLACPAIAQDLHFAPEERLDKIDVGLIENADTNIDLAAYVLTDWAIIDALNDASARGVTVRIIIDPRQHSDLTHLIGEEVRQKRAGTLMPHWFGELQPFRPNAG